MKKVLLMLVSGILFYSCGSSKASSSYDSSRQNDKKHLTMKKQEIREVDKLVAQETNKMRAVGIGNDYEEKDARREAMNDARTILAGYIETAVIALTQEWTEKNRANKDKLSEAQRKEFVEQAVAQKVSTRLIGTPEIYNVSDGTIQVYVCLELTKSTADILGDVYDNLTREDVIGIDYNREQFINDNIDRIKELREKVK